VDNVRQPVVGDQLAGDIQDQPAQRVALVGVGLHPPVAAVEVVVDRGGHVHQRLLRPAQLGVLFAVDDVGARGGHVVGADQHLLDHVLDLLDRRRLAGEAVAQHLDRLDRQQFGFISTEGTGCLAGALDRRADAGAVERYRRPIAGHDP